MDSDSDAPLVNSGRFMALSRDSDGSGEDVETQCDEKGSCADFPRKHIQERPFERTGRWSLI